MADNKPVNISGEIFDSAKAYADLIGWSGKAFFEGCMQAIITLHETPPKDRKIPLIVALLDTAKANRPNLNPDPESVATDKLAKEAGKSAARKLATDEPKGQTSRPTSGAAPGSSSRQTPSSQGPIERKK